MYWEPRQALTARRPAILGALACTPATHGVKRDVCWRFRLSPQCCVDRRSEQPSGFSVERIDCKASLPFSLPRAALKPWAACFRCFQREPLDLGRLSSRLLPFLCLCAAGAYAISTSHAPTLQSNHASHPARFAYAPSIAWKPFPRPATPPCYRGIATWRSGLSDIYSFALAVSRAPVLRWSFNLVAHSQIFFLLLLYLAHGPRHFYCAIARNVL